MEYTRLGSSGLVVSRVIFGGSHIGESLDGPATTALVRAAWDAGVTTFYTADSYAGGEAQAVLGQAIRERRDD
jgi:aryl-alcohol dehydrogenase-like predicted oxidoreductase